jgi:hypothetical protein
MDAGDALSLIRARIPQLSAREFGAIEAALSGQTVPASALSDVVAVLELLEERFDGLQGRLNRVAEAGLG